MKIRPSADVRKISDPQRIYRGQVRLSDEVSRTAQQDEALESLARSNDHIVLEIRLHNSSDVVELLLPPQLMRDNPGSRLVVDGEVESVLFVGKPKSNNLVENFITVKSCLL